MAIVNPTDITALDGITPPSTSDPTNFDARADALLTALPTLQSQINTTADQTYGNALDAFTSASQASTSAAAASASASESSLSAISASSAGNAAKWTAGTSFGEGTCCWSPVDFQTYRKITEGTSTTGEPTVTPGTWRSLAPVNHLANLSLGII